jgi:hypothetical protein
LITDITTCSVLELWLCLPTFFCGVRKARANQNPYIEEEQTTQWPKEKVQKDKQRSTKHTYKTEDRVTRTPQKNVGVMPLFTHVF